MEIGKQYGNLADMIAKLSYVQGEGMEEKSTDKMNRMFDTLGNVIESKKKKVPPMYASNESFMAPTQAADYGTGNFNVGSGLSLGNVA